MTNDLNLHLTSQEYAALQHLAQRELRGVNEMAHYILRGVLIELGELQNEEEKDDEEWS